MTHHIDWNKAPHWATGVARDNNGSIYWFENKPICNSSEWLNDPSIGGRIQQVTDQTTSWKYSYTERPIVSTNKVQDAFIEFRDKNPEFVQLLSNILVDLNK